MNRFPLSNELLTKKWVDALKRKNFKPSQSSRICSVHFTEQDYQLRPDAHRPLLKENAVPSIFPSFPSYYQKEKKRPRKQPASRIQITNNISNIFLVIYKSFTFLCRFCTLFEYKLYFLDNPCSDQSENIELATTSGNSCDKEVQTLSTYTSEIMLKKKIKVLQQKLKRQKIKIDNLDNLLKSLKNKGVMDEESNNFIANNFDGNFITANWYCLLLLIACILSSLFILNA